jgi:hypothetical protein
VLGSDEAIMERGDRTDLLRSTARSHRNVQLRRLVRTEGHPSRPSRGRDQRDSRLLFSRNIVRAGQNRRTSPRGALVLAYLDSVSGARWSTQRELLESARPRGGKVARSAPGEIVQIAKLIDAQMLEIGLCK